MTALSVTIGNRIRTKRTKMHMTQADLARSVGVSSASYIGNIETGRACPSLAVLDDLCNALKTSPTWLMGRGR